MSNKPTGLYTWEQILEAATKANERYGSWMPQLWVDYLNAALHEIPSRLESPLPPAESSEIDEAAFNGGVASRNAGYKIDANNPYSKTAQPLKWHSWRAGYASVRVKCLKCLDTGFVDGIEIDYDAGGNKIAGETCDCRKAPLSSGDSNG